MKKVMQTLAISLAGAALAAPALASEPLTLVCQWRAERVATSSFDSTRKKGERAEVSFHFDFDQKEVTMEGLSGAASDLTATTSAISFCVDQCGKSEPFKRNTEDGPVTATFENGRVTINRLTGAISWARTEEQFQGAQPYYTITNSYVGACEKAATLTPKF